MAISPRVLFKSKLKLTGEQELRLMTHCMDRRTGIRTECGFLNSTSSSGLGVVGVNNSMWSGAALDGFARKRFEAYSMYENDFAFRALAANSNRYGTLYKIFNCSLNIPQRAINVYKAKACEALFNTSPFTGFMPEGDDDPGDVVKLAERVFHGKLDDADMRFRAREAVTQACISEAVVKTAIVPVVIDPEIDENAQIYLDAQGKPIRDSLGGYVFGDEEVEYHPDVLDVRVLTRDPSVTLDGTETLSDPAPMLREARTEFKLDIGPVGWNNFFCSPLAADIHTTDCIFHEYDELFSDMMRRVQGLQVNKQAKAWLTNVKDSAARYPQTEGGQPVWARGERDVEMFGPVQLHICEQWLKFDLFDRNQADELCVIWAVNGNGTESWPIYYDTMRRASPTKKRPFDVWRVIPVRDRWHGFGFYDLLSNDHDFVDDAWNRIRVRSSASGRMDWMRRDSFEGLEYGRPASLSDGGVKILKSNVEGEGKMHIGSIAFPEMDEKIWKMLELAMQIAQLRSGTMTPGDAAASGLPSNKTATGQDLLANESDLSSNDTTQDLIRGSLQTLKQAIMAVFTNDDDDSARAFTIYVNELLGVEDGAKLLNWLKTNKPEKFSKHVKLLLTKARSKQQLQSNSQANAIITGGLSWVEIVQQYPQWADQLRAFFEGQLNALDVPNAKGVLKIPDAIMQQALAQQAMTSQQPTQMPVKQTQQAAIPAAATK